MSVVDVAEMLASGYRPDEIQRELGIGYAEYSDCVRLIRHTADMTHTAVSHHGRQVIRDQFQLINGRYHWLDLEGAHA